MKMITINHFYSMSNITLKNNTTEKRCENVAWDDTTLQMKLTKLLNELSPRQQINHSEMLDLAMKSKEDRKNNTDMCTFTQTPATKKLINWLWLKKKQSILNSILKLTIYPNSSSSVVFLKNALMLDIDVTTMRAKNALINFAIHKT